MNPNETFASTAAKQTIIFPQKDQAIILNSVDGIKIKDYIFKIGNIVKPNNILFASRISNNRVCIYLKSKELVETLTKNHKTIEIENNEISVRPMVRPAKRIILSNVCPSIPHEIIENVLKSKQIHLLSPINFLKVGMQDEGYTHILSFRRHVYISPEDEEIVPETLLIDYDNITYRIFLSEESISCFLCKGKGHITSLCPNVNNPTVIAVPTSLTPKRQLSDTTDSNVETNSIPKIDQNQVQQTQNVKQPTSKITENTNNQQSVDETSKERKPKKPRPSNPAETFTVQQLIEPLRNIIENNQDKYILSFDELQDFLENVHGSSEQLQISLQYTKQTHKLLEMMSDLYPFLLHRTMKSRFTRIMSQIKKQLNISSSQESLC